MISVKVKGAREVSNFIARLGPQLNKDIMKVAGTFSTNVQKSAKLRAPRLTGRLAESINVKKGKKNQISISVDSPYGYFQEYGFRPHFIHSNMSDRMGGTVGGLFGKFNSFFFVAKHKPFIIPALEHNIARLPEMLSQGTKQAIKHAGGK
jgi:hypothetical protein